MDSVPSKGGVESSSLRHNGPEEDLLKIFDSDPCSKVEISLAFEFLFFIFIQQATLGIKNESMDIISRLLDR